MSPFRSALPYIAVVVATLVGVPNDVSAQVNCETIPAGPARTDCYIGLSRIGQQKSQIAAGAARQLSNSAKLREATGATRKKKPRRKRVPQ